LLADPEWFQWSDGEIARRCAVTDRYVSKLRKGASPNCSGMRQRLARRGASVYEIETAPAGPTTGAMTDAKPEALGAVTVPQPPATDPLGLPLSGAMAEVLAVRADFQAAQALYTQLADLLDCLARKPGGELVRQHLRRTAENGQERFACADLCSSMQKVLAAEPYCSLCPPCQLANPGWSPPDCRTCHGRGWTTQADFEACLESYRRDILRSAIP
jgi:hypothetical protein